MYSTLLGMIDLMIFLSHLTRQYIHIYLRHRTITTAARGIAFDVIPDGRPEEVLQLFRFIRQVNVPVMDHRIRVFTGGLTLFLMPLTVSMIMFKPTTRNGSVKKVMGGGGAGVIMGYCRHSQGSTCTFGRAS